MRRLSQEEFNLWLRSNYSGAFYVGGHKFEKTDTDDIRVDNGLFKRDEAAQLYRMLSSGNPAAQINGWLAILERSGALLWILLAVSFILMFLIVIRIRR